MITIVISSYKYGHLASHCIETILAQTKQPEKILFVDDGVGDCFHLKKIYGDSVEFVFRDKNLGVVENFDDMLKRVQTDRVMFIGADNWLRSDSLEKLSSYQTDIVTYDIMVTGGFMKNFEARGEGNVFYQNGDLYWSRKMVHHGSILYNAELGKKVGYSSPKGRFSLEDLNMFNGMIELGATLSHCPEALLFYRQHKQNFNQYT